MLRQLRRLEKTRGLVILFFIALLAVSLIIFYAPGRNARVATLTDNAVLATVDGDEITAGDITRRREALSRLYSGINLAQLGIDEERLLDGLIRDRVITQEAARRGLGVSDAELGARIREQFRDGGQFIGADRYKQIAIERYGSVERLEREFRDALAVEKLRAFVGAGVQVSPQEVEDQYKRQNASFDVVYVSVEPDKLTKQINPSDDEVKQYFDQHQTDYRVLESQKKFRYLYIDQAKVGEKLSIPDDELKKEYAGMSPEVKRSGVKAQQLVLKVADPKLDATVKAKADELVARARKDGGMDEAAFAELVRGNSEDPATAKTGGAITVKRPPGKPVSTDPLQSALTMAPNSISEPLKGKGIYIILRRGEDIPKTFEEAKQELLVSARNRKSYNTAADLARRAAEKLKQTKDVQKAAQEFAGEANMKAEDMVKETGFIKPGDNIPNIGVNQQFEQAVSGLNDEGAIGDQIQVPGGFAVPMLIGKREPGIPPFDEVKDRVASALKQERAKSQLEQYAKDLIKNAGNAGGLKAAAEKLGLEAKTNDKYKLGGSFEGAGNSPAADEAVFALKDGEVAANPFLTDDNYLVVGMNKRTDADMSKYNEQKDSLMDSAVTTRRSQVFEDYISALIERMKGEGRIKIDRAVLDQVIEDSPASPPPSRPNFPMPRK